MSQHCEEEQRPGLWVPSCGHSIFKPSCTQCQGLQQQAYCLLKSNGFKDIEDTSHPHRPLLTWQKYRHQSHRLYSNDEIEQINTYYQQATALLDTYNFKNPTHKYIWQLHSQGISKRKIEKLLKTHPKPYKRENIALIINSIAKNIKS